MMIETNVGRSFARRRGIAAIGRVATNGSGRVGRCRVRSRAGPPRARAKTRVSGVGARSNAKRKGLRDRRARASRRALAGPRRTATHLLHLLLVMQRVVKHLLGALAHGHHLLVLLPQPLRLFLEPIGGRRGILERLRGPVHGLVHNRLGAFGFLEPVDVPRRLGGDRPTHVAQSATARPGAHRVGGIHLVGGPTARLPRASRSCSSVFSPPQETFSRYEGITRYQLPVDQLRRICRRSSRLFDIIVSNRIDRQFRLSDSNFWIRSTV